MARIIKAEQTRWVDGKWVVEPARLGNPQDEDPNAEPAPDPAALLAEVQEQVVAIRAQAEAQAQELIETVTRAAYEDGLTQGRDEAYQEGMAQFAQILGSLDAAVQGFLAEREARYAEAEPDVVTLALLIAGKILGREPRDAGQVRNLVKAAIAKVNADTVVRVRLNPQDVGRLVNPLTAPPKYEVLADPEVGVGGCVVETSTGRVDASFAAQFEEMARTLLDVETETDPRLKDVFGDLKRPVAPPKPREGGFGR
jgi:flagellar assembly protein FliH